MKTTHSDERELDESLSRHAIPAFAWAALFAFFAVAGALSREEPTRMAEAAIALRQTASASAGMSTVAFNAPQDKAVVEHESLDPVGVGLNAAR